MFNKQQDHSVVTINTADANETLAIQMVIEEETFAQSNIFVKAQSLDDGKSMNLIFQCAVKRLSGSPTAAIVGVVQQNSNQRDAGATWTVQIVTVNENLEIHVTGAAGVNIQWTISFFIDWIF